jgi:hypothetical protein
MSLASVLQRVATIDQALANPVALTGGTAAPSGIATAGGSAGAGGEAAGGAGQTATPAPTFASALAQANAATPVGAAAGIAGTTIPVGTPAGIGATTPLGAQAGSGYGARIVAAAESQIGQSEQPPGSNESPAIAEYRSATAGAIPGAPWCAYFASWAARQAGEPIGANGAGLGGVSEISSWAQSTGRAIPNGPGVVPKPGDLIVFGGEHVGIVRGVLPNGNIQTIEGNYENKVALNERPPGEATSYVEMS